MSGRLPGALADLRILEVSDESGQHCGKLLADMGADVLLVEPPTGHPARRVGPFVDDVPGPDRSLFFWHYNTSKRSITLDLRTADGREIFRRLAERADVVLETCRPGYLPSLGLGYEQLRERNPRLIYCSLTPFGQDGPWHPYLTTDLVHLALGGQMASSGYDDVPGAPPIAPTGGNAWHIGSHYAAIGIMGAVVARDRLGTGQYIDASIHEACAGTTEMAVPFYIYTGSVVKRQTGRHAMLYTTPPWQFRCKDGKYVNALLLFIDLVRWQNLVSWLDNAGMAEDLTEDIYLIPEVQQERIFHIVEVVGRFIAAHNADEIYHGGQQRNLPWTPVRAVEDLVEDPQLTEDRQFFAHVEHPEIGRTVTYIGAPYKFSATPWRIQRRPPLLGEHNREIYEGELRLPHDRVVSLAEAGVF